MEEAIVRCKTTAGPFVLKLERSWSPNGYDRAVELFERGFFDQSHFFRVVNNFLVQFGISYSSDKELQRFARSTIKDDPPKGIKFQKGTVSYAGNGDDSRTSQLFISYGHAASLGRERWVSNTLEHRRK
jgi:cyclophilin family peptidyl-prolyl cis-trans isomerase